MANTNYTVRRSVRSAFDKHSLQLLLVSASVGTIVGCSGSDSLAPPAEVGGSDAVGGSNAAGGANGSGGSSVARTSAGGASASGGVAATGGAAATGGRATGGTSSVATGGNLPTGGRATGGAATGGSSPAATGGAATGGKAATGGAGGGTAATGGATPSTGGTTGIVGTKPVGTAQSGDITVNPTKQHQIVDGFGLADVWQGSSSTQMQTLLWDPVNGIGLNCCASASTARADRPTLWAPLGMPMVRPASSMPAVIARCGQHRGRRPRETKTTTTSTTVGICITSDYDSWATILAAFPAFYKKNGGVDLYAISAQNEPDFTASYQSCLFNSSQMVAWIDVLGPKLAALSPPVKVLAAEPDNWGNIWGGDDYGPAIIADTNANNYVGPIATHDYGGTSAGTYARPAPPANNTHHVWETECTPGDTGPITIATMIYAAFNTGGVSGWHYWWTEAFIPSASSPPSQYYALGNFSKFVRPGYYRVDVSGAPAASASNPGVVAFSSLTDGTTTIVVVNPGSARTLSFFVGGTAWPASVTPYVTTASSNLAAGTPITLTAARFSGSVQAASVTTFVGKP